MGKALLIMHENGILFFSRDTQQGHIEDDDVLFNWVVNGL
jgi:hypothetical protein